MYRIKGRLIQDRWAVEGAERRDHETHQTYAYFRTLAIEGKEFVNERVSESASERAWVGMYFITVPKILQNSVLFILLQGVGRLVFLADWTIDSWDAAVNKWLRRCREKPGLYDKRSAVLSCKATSPNCVCVLMFLLFFLALCLTYFLDHGKFLWFVYTGRFNNSSNNVGTKQCGAYIPPETWVLWCLWTSDLVDLKHPHAWKLNKIEHNP